MMNLYSGTTCPFSQRCRIVLYEKGMDFQIIDVDMYNKPEDIAAGYEDGILTVTVPKAEEEKPKRIEVKAKKTVETAGVGS